MTSVWRPMGLLYSDTGGRLDDRAILRNAVVFTTAQRAYRAARVLREPLDRLSALEWAFLAVEAFDVLAVSLEDLMGWLFVLRDWTPGATGERSLFSLLDTVEVGRDQWSEDAALGLVKSLDAAGYRRLAHIPSSEELKALGWAPLAVAAVDRLLEAQLKGFTRAVERRASDHRAMVKAYNKSKHMLLGILQEGVGKHQVGLLTSASRYGNPGSAHLAGTVLDCAVEDIQRHATEAIQAQAVLNSVLTLVLWTRYGERRPSPQWVASAYRLLELRGVGK